MVKPTEKAVIVINGEEFSDWETVYVKHSDRDDPRFLFRVTCSEGMPLAKNWAKLRIRPGHACTIILAGQLAMTARVSLRNVFCDAHRHYVEIQGETQASMLSDVAAVTENMEFLDRTPLDIAKSLAGRYGIGVITEGGSVPNIKIPRFSINIGETVNHAMERLFKTVSDKMPGKGNGPLFTSDPMGNFVINFGSIGSSETLVEGKNIISGREWIYNYTMKYAQVASGQRPPTDNKTWGAGLTSVPFLKSILNYAPGFAPAWNMLETAAWNNKMLTQSNANDAGFLNTDNIVVTIVVYGWLKPSGGLWRINQPISVESPMLILKGNEGLFLFRAEFTQDDSTGTRTTLTIVNDVYAQSVPGGPLEASDTTTSTASGPGPGAGPPIRD